MQDNYSQHEFDTAFIQKSWSELSDKLDSEMPVITPRSRKVAYILGVSQIVSLAVIAFLLYQSHQKVPYATVTKTQTVSENIPASTTPAQVRTETKTVTKYVPGPTKYLYINTADSFSTTTEEEVVPNSTTNNEALKAIDTYQRRNNYLFSKRNLSSQPDVNLALTYDDEFSKESQLKNFFRNDVDFRIGILSSISNDFDFSGYGVVTSLQVAISDKLAISTGIGYNHLSRQFSFLPIFNKSRNSYAIIGRKVDLGNQTTYYKSLHDLKQIFIPISLNYYVSQKIALSSGVKFRHTFDSSVNGNLKSELKQSISTIKNPETLFFNDTNFGLSLGINYSLSQRITLQLDSEIGFNSIINTNQFDSAPQSRYDLQLINFTTNYSF